MIAKLLKGRAICKSVALSLTLLSVILLISCGNKADDIYVTKETNSSSEKISSRPNIVTNETNETVKINPKKLTPLQITQSKKALAGKNIIADHAFEVNLENFGNTLFVPASESSPTSKLGLYLVKDNQVKYTFPLPEDVQAWNFLELDAVSFEKLNSPSG